jgi:hypothetical protein
MNVHDATELCAEHGSLLLQYHSPRVAMLMLPSAERLLISIGTMNAKIFRRNALFGWFLPRCVASQSLSAWEPRYTQFNSLHRTVCRGMVLDGLVDLVSRAKSIDELRLAWCALKNPLEVSSVALFKQTFPDTQFPTDATNQA